MKIKVKLTMKITGSFGQICAPSTISYVFRKKGHKSIKGGGGSLRVFTWCMNSPFAIFKEKM